MMEDLWKRAALGACVGLALAASARAADEKPREMDATVSPVPFERGVFKADPRYEETPYDAGAQVKIYGGKTGIDEPRPWLELGRPLYTEGPFSEGINLFGAKNLVFPGFTVFGDWRNVVAFNDNGAKEAAQVATRLNLDLDLRLTSTERFHAFVRPFDVAGDATRYEFAGDDRDHFVRKFNGNLETMFFEGDLGAIATGLTGSYNRADIPVAAGLVPMIFQNGIWVEDAFVGGAIGIPARNFRSLDISNMDITFFGGFDKVTTPAFGEDDHNADIYGVAVFAEAMQGYWEGGFGRVDGRGGFRDLSYNSLTAAYTARYGGWLSNSVRGIWTFGQEAAGRQQTADGFIFLVENSFVTRLPSTLVPYVNGWVGIDRPTPLARAEGNLLKNTGINFETDGVTKFPKLDDSGQNTFGFAAGLQYLFNLDQQIVVEAAALQVIGGPNEPGRAARDDQYGLQIRYQLPISLDWIIRADAMVGFRDNDSDIAGVRFELRNKF